MAGWLQKGCYPPQYSRPAPTVNHHMDALLGYDRLHKQRGIVLDVGKFPARLLRAMLAKNSVADPRVLLGSAVGEDAAVLDLGDNLLVASSDPVTFASDLAGWYSVHVNANDVACSGAQPQWFLATLLVPQEFSEADAQKVFDQILEACAAVGASLIGGHSEVTHGISRPIILGTMLGEVARDRLVSTGGAQEGDSIVLTKGVAIEGTALLARDRADDLRRAGIPADTIARAAGLLASPGISVLSEARVACSSAQVHSMHDVTEGGLASALAEVSHASGLGLTVEEDTIPVLPECRAICQALGLQPLGLLASGALLITLNAAEAPSLLAGLGSHNIKAWEIGRLLAPEEGLSLVGRQGAYQLPQFPRDELARYLSSPNTGKDT